MLEKIKKYQNHPLLDQLRDVKSLGLIAFAVIVVLVSWSGVRTIQVNYQLERQMADLRQQNAVKELENNNQKLKNQYYNTPQYLDLAARQNFGLALPGEKELVVPKDVAMRQVEGVKAIQSGASLSGEVESISKNTPLFQRNFQAWINFFLHRGV